MYTAENGKEYVRKTGSRQEVWDEVVFCTSGKLKKEDLVMKNGRIMSKKRSEMGKKRFATANPFQKKAEAPQVVPDEPSEKPDAKPRFRTVPKRRRRRAR